MLRLMVTVFAPTERSLPEVETFAPLSSAAADRRRLVTSYGTVTLYCVVPAENVGESSALAQERDARFALADSGAETDALQRAEPASTVTALPSLLRI